MVRFSHPYPNPTGKNSGEPVPDALEFLAPDVLMEDELLDLDSSKDDTRDIPIDGSGPVCSAEDIESLRAVFDRAKFQQGVDAVAKIIAAKSKCAPNQKHIQLHLPDEAKLGKAPKGKNRTVGAITDGFGCTGITSNKGSFCWTLRDAVQFNLCQYNHKFAFVCMVTSWCNKSKAGRHYFQDSRLSVQVCADTLGYTVDEYLKLRGWSLHYKNGVPLVEYRKLRELLLSVGSNGKFIELHAMILRCVCQVSSDPHLKRRVQIEQARTIRDRITRHTHAFHTAVFAVGEALHPLLPDACDRRKLDKFHDQIEKIFFNAKNRKDMISNCHLLMEAFPRPETVITLDKIHGLKDTLTNDPETFINYVDNNIAPLHKNSQTPRMEYETSLLRRLKHVFCDKKVPSSYISKNDYLLIVRFKIHHEYYVTNPSEMPEYWPRPNKRKGKDPVPIPPPLKPPQPNNPAAAGGGLSPEQAEHMKNGMDLSAAVSELKAPDSECPVTLLPADESAQAHTDTNGHMPPASDAASLAQPDFNGMTLAQYSDIT